MQSVAKLMKEKHPPAAPLAQRHMAEFEGWLAEGGEGLPPLTPPTFEASDVEAAVVKLHGGAGLSGVTAHSLVRLLTVHGQASFAFRKAVARYTTVRGAILIDWVKLRAIALGDLEAKKVRPIGIGEAVERLACRLLVSSTKAEVVAACGASDGCFGNRGSVESEWCVLPGRGQGGLTPLPLSLRHGAAAYCPQPG